MLKIQTIERFQHNISNSNRFHFFKQIEKAQLLINNFRLTFDLNGKLKKE